MEKGKQETKHAERCLAHLNKTACEIWSIFDKDHFCNAIFPPNLIGSSQMNHNVMQQGSKHHGVSRICLLTIKSKPGEIVIIMCTSGYSFRVFICYILLAMKRRS